MKLWGTLLCCIFILALIASFFGRDVNFADFVQERGTVLVCLYHGQRFDILVHLEDDQIRQVTHVDAYQWRSFFHGDKVIVTYWRGCMTGWKFNMSIEHDRKENAGSR